MFVIILNIIFILLLICSLIGLLFLSINQIIKISKNKNESNNKKGFKIFGLVLAIMILIQALFNIFTLHIPGLRMLNILKKK
jgi:hypothetical protein